MVANVNSALSFAFFYSYHELQVGYDLSYSYNTFFISRLSLQHHQQLSDTPVPFTQVQPFGILQLHNSGRSWHHKLHNEGF